MIGRIQKVLISLGVLLFISFFVVGGIAAGGTNNPMPWWAFILLGVALPCFLIPLFSLIVSQMKRPRMASARAESTGNKPVTTPTTGNPKATTKTTIIQWICIGVVSVLGYYLLWPLITKLRTTVTLNIWQGLIVLIGAYTFFFVGSCVGSAIEKWRRHRK